LEQVSTAAQAEEVARRFKKAPQLTQKQNQPQNPHHSMETTTLYYNEGASDKVYQVTIEPKGDGYGHLGHFGRLSGSGR